MFCVMSPRWYQYYRLYIETRGRGETVQSMGWDAAADEVDAMLCLPVIIPPSTCPYVIGLVLGSSGTFKRSSYDVLRWLGYAPGRDSSLLFSGHQVSVLLTCTTPPWCAASADTQGKKGLLINRWKSPKHETKWPFSLCKLIISIILLW